jgi:NTP pyrophosphatase (non-canonical NTP hydrolase)
MDMNDYQKLAMKTAIFPTDMGVYYATLGLAGEAGEIANKVKKFIRDGHSVEKEKELISELGDVLWYVAAVADVIGVSLEDVAKDNMYKLAERQRNGTLQGSGDNR